MSSATTLYAVDLDAVKRAVGSNDTALRDRVLANLSSLSGPTPPTGPTAIMTDDGGVTFNGVPMTPAQFAMELRKPEWTGCQLLCHERRDRRKMARIPAKYVELNSVLTAAMVDGIITKLNWQSPPEEEDEDELSLEQAVADLFTGKWSNKDEDQRYQYAYALEQLCLTLRTHRVTIEGDEMLAYLGLGVPLSKLRSPVKLPRTSDVPLISYLTADEVKAEAGRLAGMTLALPDSPEIESSRREYAQFISDVAGSGQAVVAFYY